MCFSEKLHQKFLNHVEIISVMSIILNLVFAAY